MISVALVQRQLSRCSLMPVPHPPARLDEYPTNLGP